MTSYFQAAARQGFCDSRRLPIPDPTAAEPLPPSPKRRSHEEHLALDGQAAQSEAAAITAVHERRAFNRRFEESQRRSMEAATQRERAAALEAEHGAVVAGQERQQRIRDDLKARYGASFIFEEGTVQSPTSDRPGTSVGHGSTASSASGPDGSGAFHQPVAGPFSRQALDKQLEGLVRDGSQRHMTL